MGLWKKFLAVLAGIWGEFTKEISSLWDGAFKGVHTAVKHHELFMERHGLGGEIQYKFDPEGESFFRFLTKADADAFAFRAWFHGMTFDRHEEYEEIKGRPPRRWIVLTLRELPNSAGRGSMRGPRMR